MKTSKEKQIRVWIARVLVAMLILPWFVPAVVNNTRPVVIDEVVEPSAHTEPTETTVQPTEVVNNSVNSVENFVEDEKFYDEVIDPTFAGYPEHTYTDEELEILAIIIYQEAGGDGSSDDTRRKVGSVFLNRVNSDRFPNTFYEVATARSQYGTLHWTGIKWPDRASNSREAHAVERAYRIAEELITNGSILPSNVIWQAGFVQGDGIYCYQDGTYFCYSGGIE